VTAEPVADALFVRCTYREAPPAFDGALQNGSGRYADADKTFHPLEPIFSIVLCAFVNFCRRFPPLALRFRDSNSMWFVAFDVVATSKSTAMGQQQALIGSAKEWRFHPFRPKVVCDSE
jgi:hypothetical protein